MPVKQTVNAYFSRDFETWIRWVAHHPGSFLSITAGLITGVATFILAWITRSLVRQSQVLAEVTKTQGDNSELANRRIYRLTQLQIDLHYRASYYEDIVLVMLTQLDYLRGIAVKYGIDCDQVALFGTQPMTHAKTEDILLSLRLRFHASQAIKESVIAWVATASEKTKKLESYVVYDSYSQIQPLTESLLSSVTAEFLHSHSSLEEMKEEIVEAMILELHPSE